MPDTNEPSLSYSLTNNAIENVAQCNNRATEHLVRALDYLDAAVRALEQAFRELPPPPRDRETDSEALVAALGQFRSAACNLLN